MKKILLSITYFIACIFYIKAQVLYGTTSKGGNDNGGTITEFIPATNNLIVAKSFESIALAPSSNLIQASDGRLYGMTPLGGSSGNGVIFSFDPSSSSYSKRKNFDGINGAGPYGSLVQTSNGMLYGTTYGGGSHSLGVIFSFNPSTSTYTKLRDFDNTGGSNPHGSLVQATNGKLYGMTYNGGSNGYGVIFSFDPSSSTYTKLKDFDGISGAYPYGGLMQAGNGKLYGMTSSGGSSGNGVIFSFDPSSSTYTKLKDFDGTNGAYPYGGGLIQATDGKLYGTTYEGGINDAGVIFSFDLSSSVYTKLNDFDHQTGGGPTGIIQASDGRLYGATAHGGDLCGIIFSFDPHSFIFTSLKKFNCTDAGYPSPDGSLMQASNGKLYGMTAHGGSGDDGVIYSFDPTATIYTKLRDFGANENGSNPSGSFIKANDGKLYGLTFGGGNLGYGVIFSFDPSASIYKKLMEFDHAGGSYPQGSLTQASNGKLYGTTYTGGSNGAGVIFSFDLSSSTYTKLKDFDNANMPGGSLVQASDGKLYGMANSGGSSGYGFIFSFDPSSSTFTQLKDFNFTNGAYPTGNLIQATNGKLYGMTAYGGSSEMGVLFSFDPSSSTYTNLKDCDETSGAYPSGSLIKANNGKLYGMTPYGGSSGNGVIFSFDPSSSTYTKLKDFDGTNGSNPFGDLMQSGNSKLYGMTSAGGSSGNGVIFSFDLSSSTITKLKDYNGANGAGAGVGSAFIETSESGPLPVTLLSFKGKNNGNTNELTWKVDNEQNLNYYQLQRGIDGQNFSGISQIKATGNSIYVYNDQTPAMMSSFYYYRLKSVDNDGKFKYSEVIKIRTDLNGFAVVNPNPFKDRLMVTVQSLAQDEATFIITDVSGRQLYKEIKLLSPGTNVVQINEGKLSKGTYLLTIIKSQQTQSIKVINGN